MIQQFQPKYNPSMNTATESQRTSEKKNLIEVIPQPLNAVTQMPYTVVTKVTPIGNDKDSKKS